MLERFAIAVFEVQQDSFNTPANVLMVVQNNPDSVIAFRSTYYHHAIVNSCRFIKITSKALQDDIADIATVGHKNSVVFASRRFLQRSQDPKS
jgi:hypothetical protein